VSASGAPRPAPRMTAAFVAFRNPSFRWHWVSTLSSFSAMQMQTVALGILGWKLSGSYAVVGILQAAFAIPMAIFALPGGAMVDRIEKRRVVALSQSVLGLIGATIAVLVHADLITIVLLFIGGAIQGALFSVNGPARTALLSEIVTTEELPAAMSMQNIAMNGTRVVGPALAGILIALVSVHGAYYATALLYLTTVWAILHVPRTSAHEGRARRPILSEVRAGLGYVFGHQLLRSLMLSGLAVALFIMPYQVMLPGFADSLGHEELFGAMIAVSGVGGLIGSFGAALAAQSSRKPYVQFILGLCAGGALIALGSLPLVIGPAGAFLALAAVGAFSTAYMTLNQTMLMVECDPAYRGRVMSIAMLTFSAMPLMALPLGILADAIGGSRAFMVQGSVVFFAMIALAVVNRAHTFGGRTAPTAVGEPAEVASRTSA
jgi:MFS family permease